MDTPDSQTQSSDHSPREVVDQLINAWNLLPHPEGGWYREMHRSPEQVTRSDGAQRSSITAILFLLDAGSKSCWHAVHGADEIWIHLQGSPLSLWTLEPEGSKAVHHVLSLHHPLHVAPAGHWQAARTEGQYSLVSCCVGPGFQFEDFEMLKSRPPQQHPPGALPDLL